MEEFSIVMSCFKNSYFLRSITDPKTIESINKKEKSLIESMIIYETDEIKEKTRLTLSDISYKDGKYYLEGSFMIREDKSDAYIYPSFEEVFNSNTRLGTLGSYETVAYFKDDTLKFETDFGGYKTIIGGNLDGSSLQDNIINKTSKVVNNYIERISGRVEEEFTYDNSLGEYIHKSVVSKDVENLVIDPNFEHIIEIPLNLKKEQKSLVNKYAYLKNERDRQLKEIESGIHNKYIPSEEKQKTLKPKKNKQAKRRR